MTEYIRISDPIAGPDQARRLNPFTGRYLSEREFELLQSYVDDRITPLVAGLPAGIISGLEVRFEGSGSNTVLTIQSGVAVGAAGKLMRLFYPLRQEWPELAGLVTRELDGALRDGLYFLTLRSVVEPVDAASGQKPCTRTESDPLRELRLETIIRPGLRFISATPGLLDVSRARAANRVCVRFLNESPLDRDEGTISVALVKVVNGNPEWIDTEAGRYLSEPNAPYRTFLAHSITLLERWMEEGGLGNVTTPLSVLLDVDFLPAAGPLPSVLVKDLANSKTDKLAFNSLDLQVELAPVPASSVGAVIDRELPRGAVDLVHGSGDRIRMLLAIPDLEFRPWLLDLPQRDTALEDELFYRGKAAVQSWQQWRQQWQLLYDGLGSDQLKMVQAPELSYRPAPCHPHDCRTELVKQRLVTMYGNKIEFPASGGGDLAALKTLCDNGFAPPEPYLSHLLAPHDVKNYTDGEPLSSPEEKLMLLREELNGSIRTLESDLDESYRLLNEMNDYLNLQRQHLDTLTISFSALAGGIAGDGSGSSMMRWNSSTAFDPTVQNSTKG